MILRTHAQPVIGQTLDWNFWKSPNELKLMPTSAAKTEKHKCIVVETYSHFFVMQMVEEPYLRFTVQHCMLLQMGLIHRGDYFEEYWR